jgi:hypothetical protein
VSEGGRIEGWVCLEINWVQKEKERERKKKRQRRRRRRMEEEEEEKRYSKRRSPGRDRKEMVTVEREPRTS